MYLTRQHVHRALPQTFHVDCLPVDLAVRLQLDADLARSFVPVPRRTLPQLMLKAKAAEVRSAALREPVFFLRAWCVVRLRAALERER